MGWSQKMDQAWGLGPPRVRVGPGGRVWLGPGRHALWANVTRALPGPTQGHMINGPTESRSGQPCSACTTGVSGPGLGPRGLESSFPSPNFSVIKCQVEGSGTGPALWGHLDCPPAFQPPGGKVQPAAHVFGVCVFGA